MTVTIDQESRYRSKLSIDVDYSADRYKTENGYFTFPSPVLETIDKNLYFLLKNSKSVSLDKKYYYRPDYLSYDEYGTVALANLLMYINNIPSLEHFTNATIIVPTYAAISTILTDKFPDRKVDSLDEVNW